MVLKKLAGAGNRRTDAEATVAFISQNSKKYLKELFQLFHLGDKLLQQRGSYALHIISDKHPDWLIPFHKELLYFAENPLHPGVQRNTLAALSSQNQFDEKIIGELIDFCFELVNNPSTKIASRVFAAKIIEKQVKHYPELIPELKQMLEFHYENASGGFKACIKNILKKL